MLTYQQELEKQRQIWQDKPILRRLYTQWYRDVVGNFTSGKSNLELGSGCGNFKEFCAKQGISLVTSDYFPLPWVDRVIDATKIAITDQTLDNIFLFDVLHHISCPQLFFREARRILKKGGRVIIVEPYISSFSYLVYKYFHHEELDLNAKPLANTLAAEPNFTNEAMATLLFFKQLNQFKQLFPEFIIQRRSVFSWILYPLTGGFNYPSRIPAFLYSFFDFIDTIMVRLLPRFLAMRTLIVLEKR